MRVWLARQKPLHFTYICSTWVNSLYLPKRSVQSTEFCNCRTSLLGSRIICTLLLLGSLVSANNFHLHQPCSSPTYTLPPTLWYGNQEGEVSEYVQHKHILLSIINILFASMRIKQSHAPYWPYQKMNGLAAIRAPRLHFTFSALPLIV